MTIKDLIELFSAPSAAVGVLRANRNTSLPTATQASPAVAVGNDGLRRSEVLSSPQPTPARFLKHPERHVDMANDRTASSHLMNQITPSPMGHELTLDITDTMQHAGESAISGLPARLKPLAAPRTHRSSVEEDERPLLARHTHNYPPTTASDTIYNTHSNASSSPTLGYHTGKHVPVAASVVFARNAAPLHLPKLDKYLASLPRPGFHNATGKEGESAMFPPMDRLAKLKMTIDDLEANSPKTPVWRNRKNILGSAVNIVLGLTGSSALASFYSLQGLFNTVQIFALILSTIVPVGGQNLTDKWRKLFLGTIPNILALNFASTLVQSLFFLLIFMAIAAGLLYYFYRSSFNVDRYDIVEGLQQTGPKGKRWGLVIVTFLLTVIYLPLSTMAVHVLVWSQDLWIVPNPYTNATSFPLVVPPLSPASEYRDSLDFCWTTTMKRNQVNYAPVVIILAAIVFVFLTIWFPIALRSVIKASVPKVDKFTEFGRARNKVEMDAEYHRLLSRDRNPFSFLYSGFRRNWGTYESTYLGAKFSTLIIIAVIDSDNCLFRSLSRTHIPIIRQVLLLVCTIGFFLAQCVFAPFLDPVNNASEWTSRLNYLTTSAVALAIVLNVPGEDILTTYVLYIIYIITYGLSFYFTLINLGIAQRAVKRIARRIDFSIDIFSPRLDVSSSSLHAKRRIWQESITTLLLTTPGCAIPKEQTMTFAQARDSEFPPYLLDFHGTPGERHVENLKILREVGIMSYQKAVELVSGPDFAWYRRLEEKIQKEYIGPDCYWKNPAGPSIPECTNYFGNAWWIPFPPTLVIRYDDGPIAVLKEPPDLEAYISQNSSSDILQRRQVRLSLRALDGQVVTWPYEHNSLIGASSSWWFGSQKYRANRSVTYRSCRLSIKHQGHLVWHGLQLGSGFSVELRYGKKILLAGDAIGLNDDYDLTAPLARFFELNQSHIHDRLPHVEDEISSYRHHHRQVCRRKRQVLTYRFLTDVYDQPRDPDGFTESTIEFELDPRVRQLMANSGTVFKVAYERYAHVTKSEAATWWYIFWDDLWRRNYDTIGGLQRHAADFNPHYPTSIAYTPLPRAALEAFLVQRGLMSKAKSNGFFTSGFLNKLYLRLNDTVFRASIGAIMFHLGDGDTERDMMEVDLETRAGQPSTIGTGGGTDHDDSWIRARPNYRWEGILDDPLSKGKKGRRKWFTKFGAWLGLTPLWRSGTPSSGVSLDVRLENGHYVLIEDVGH
ncbi:hypothetical protein Hypma_015565 [Hypsizygus marmoreus]|uniref:Uncharacterized protein n=1 Tax=Hypsizygus marmoreus TaxID=39966 RepID=A0A369K6W7_HYPMA|nr:hypothetical protein Hypma_015565 [Hypsizygus marmoreus]